MSNDPRKLSFNEVLKSSVVFYNDKEFEEQFDDFIQEKVREIINQEKEKREEGLTNVQKIVNFLREDPNALLIIQTILHLSDEKLKRIITLMRRQEKDFGPEWSIKKIKKMINRDDKFATKIGKLFLEGKSDPILIEKLPLFYRERLNLKSLTTEKTKDELNIMLKDKFIGEYSNKKGSLIEKLIKDELEKIRIKYGIKYDRGKTNLIDVTVDWAIPNLDDPYVIIMSSYQETTSSGQSTKARDMITAYQSIEHINIQKGENRAFVNFVDGGGWLARRNDLRRLVAACHYFLNIANLDMLEGIILKHVPKRYCKKE